MAAMEEFSTQEENSSAPMLSPDRLLIGRLDPQRALPLAQKLGVSPITAQLLLNRGLQDPESLRLYLQGGVEALHDPFLLRDMARAVELVDQALARGRPILIHGDYDVDGVCSTVLLVEALKELGGQTLHHVPDRATEGYGVSCRAVEAAAGQGAELLITADCGSSAHEAIDLAHRLGMKVIVTDHHRLPDRLPDPEAFLNPTLPDCPYPFKGLCGAGVAFKLVTALRARRGLAAPLHLLDLVALATVADVAPLVAENRILVRSGLERLGRWQRPGLRALARVAGLDEGRVDTWAVSFALAPRLNAAGRLETADLAVRLLLSQDEAESQELARRLEAINRERQRLEREIRTEIEARLAAEPRRLDLGVIVEAGPGWHHGVIGITAGRLADLYGLPAFVLSEEGELARGSARSPENVDLFEAMKLCSDVFTRFGGHARAAGFTVETSRIPELRTRLARAVGQVRRGQRPALKVDLELPLESISLELVRELEMLEPVGEGNPRPLFLASRVRLEEARAVGSEADHLRLLARQGRARLKAIAFRQANDLDELRPGELCYDLLFHLDLDCWNGLVRPQLVVQGLVPPDPGALAVLAGRTPQARLVDSRGVLDRRKYLQRILEQSGGRLLVVASPDQAPYLQGLLGGARVPVVEPEALPDEPSGEEIVLFTPPPTLELFRHPVLASAPRLHLLFGDQELAREEHRVHARWLDRALMERAWKALLACSRQRLLREQDLPQVARALARPEDPPGLDRLQTVRQAVEVLEELGLLVREGPHLRLLGASGRKLEDSRRFQELARRRQEFQRVRQAFSSREIEAVV
jgi:single-stranded-DNA-specific exonuclease